VSGALHQQRSNVLTATNLPVGVPAALIGTIPDTEYGWAVTAQGSINLPMLAAGDALWLAATYADGALGYLGFGSGAGVTSFGGLRTNVNVVDAFIDADGDISTGEGWSIAGGLRHYWTPTIRQNVFGSYADVSYDGTLGLDFNEWRVGTNVIWSPVAGLDLGVEVMYSRLDTDTPILFSGRLDDLDDAWEGRLRVQRDF
jgi:hypothetical protein